MTLSRRHLLGIATAVALPVLAAAALGATGSLSYKGCIANHGNDDCRAPLHDSFGNNVGLTVSPDGTTVYVAAVEGTLTELRHGARGGLAFEDCLADGGRRGCRDIPHDSLDAATGVAVSPDGRSVYVTSAQRTNAVTRFKQGLDGTLVYRGCIANGGAHAGIAGCRQVPRNSLDSNEAVAVSPDGRSVYVASSDSDSITTFQRKPNGALAYRGCVANRGAHGCVRPKHDSLGGADAVAVSADGKSVYATALGGDSITAFTRSTSGRITPRGCYANSGGHGCRAPKVNSLHAADGVAVSPDGDSVYVTSMTGPTVNGGAGAVTHFKRRADGSLGYRGCFADQGRYGCRAPRLDSLGSPESIAVDPAGTAVFVGSYARAVSIFRLGAGE